MKSGLKNSIFTVKVQETDLSETNSVEEEISNAIHIAVTHTRKPVRLYK